MKLVKAMAVARVPGMYEREELNEAYEALLAAARKPHIPFWRQTDLRYWAQEIADFARYQDHLRNNSEAQ